jgi:hypothetical protein
MIILYNPHVDDFLAEPPHFRILKRRPLKKYGFFIDESLRNGQEINVLIDGTASAFIPERIFHKLPEWLRKIVTEVEYRLWCRYNNFSTLVKRVEPAKDSSNDVVLAFSYKAATGNFALRRDLLSRYQAVVFHLSHYFVSTAEKARNIQSLDNVYLAGDSDITDIPYFKGFFSWYNREFLILPFSVGSRFTIKKPFNQRLDRCVATGSFHDLSQEYPAEKYADYIKTTGEITYHPIRKAIYESAEKLSDQIDCRVSPYRQYDSKSKFTRIFKHFSVTQKKYFSIDIVDLYNNYKFAVVGEELSGFPALGAFEAMACGSVVFAQENYYKGLGVYAGKHFIAYDGTIPGLMSSFENNYSYNGISGLSANFVNSSLRPSHVYKRWADVLNGL